MGFEHLFKAHLLKSRLHDLPCDRIALHRVDEGALATVARLDKEFDEGGVAILSEVFVERGRQLLVVLCLHSLMLNGDGNKARQSETFHFALRFSQNGAKGQRR